MQSDRLPAHLRDPRDLRGGKCGLRLGALSLLRFGAVVGTLGVSRRHRLRLHETASVPAQVEPHQPRLDWQMWFAALGRYEHNPWFGGLMRRLLEGSPPVLELLEKNPFPEAPPRYVRAILYDYHFTSSKTRRETGTRWRREKVGMYCKPLSLRGR